MAAVMPESLTENLSNISARAASMKSLHAAYTFGDPEYEELAKGLPGPLPLPRPTMEEMRAHGNRFQEMRLKQDPGPQTGLVVRERSIPTKDAEILIRTYIPHDEGVATYSKRYPLLIWIHGGGYCLGNLDTNESLCRVLCIQNQVTVVNVDYRLAPEYPFPHGIDDSYSAVKWALLNAGELQVDPGLGLIVGGASSGANYVCAISILARDDEFFKKYPITGQLLLIPTTCAVTAFPEKYKTELQSRFDLPDAPGLDAHAIEAFTDAYAPASGRQPFNVLVSPLLAKSHVGLPPAYFQIAGMDPLRDEGILYEKVLRESGVKTKIHIYSGVPHGFMNLPIKARAKHREDLGQAIEWLKGLVL